MDGDEPRYDIFVSYSHLDSERAIEICDYLESLHYRCFRDRKNLLAGLGWRGQLYPALESSRCVLLLLSQHSNVSNRVFEEVAYALDICRIPVLPVCLDKLKKFHPELGGLQRLNRFEAHELPWRDYFPELANTLRQLVGEPLSMNPSGAAFSHPVDLSSNTASSDSGKAGPQLTTPLAQGRFDPGQSKLPVDAGHDPPEAAESFLARLRRTTRFPAPPSESALALTNEVGETVYLCQSTNVQFGRLADVSLPLGRFAEAQAFNDEQRAGWERLSRKHLQLTLTGGGIRVQDLRPSEQRARYRPFMNGAAWPQATMLFGARDQAVYEVAGMIRMTFRPLVCLDPQFGAFGRTSLDVDVASNIKLTGIAGCEVRVEWPSQDSGNGSRLLAVWDGVCWPAGSSSSESLILWPADGRFWLGSISPAVVLTVEGMSLETGELMGLAPGQRLHLASGQMLSVQHWPTGATTQPETLG